MTYSNRYAHVAWALLVIFGGLCAADVSGDEQTPAGTGKWPAWIDSDKIRGAFDFIHTDNRDHLATLAANGFNTVLVSCASVDVDKPEAIAQMNKQAGWCAQLGLHFFPSTRLCGGQLELRHLVPGGRAYVDGTGTTLTKTPCPVDPVFWDTVVTRRGQMVARQSLTHQIDGFLLDSEMYGADASNFPGYCLCTHCFDEFFEHRELNAAIPAAADRAAWLQQQGLQAGFNEWKARRAEALARATEQAIHQINPDLVIGVFMLDGNNWYYNAWARGFGTAGMPVLAMSENTYSTGATRYLGWTRERLKQLGAHVVLAPGMWLRQFPVENIAGHLFYMAQESAGYWVFTTLGLWMEPEPVPTNDYSLPPPHSSYLDAFSLASAELDRQAQEGEHFAAKLKLVHIQGAPRESIAAAGLLSPAQVKLRTLNPQGRSRPLPDKPTLYSGSAVCYFPVAAGKEITGILRSRPGGHQENVPVYAVIAPSGTIVAEGVLPLNEPVPLKTTAPETGLYKLVLGTQAHFFSASLDMPHAVVAAEAVRIIQQVNRMYFYVPPDVEQFRIEVGTPYVAEQAKLLVWDPGGKEAASAETFELLPAVAELHPTPEQRGKVWSFHMLPTYSANLKWDPQLPPYLAEDPEALLVPIE